MVRVYMALQQALEPCSLAFHDRGSARGNLAPHCRGPTWSPGWYPGSRPADYNCPGARCPVCAACFPDSCGDRGNCPDRPGSLYIVGVFLRTGNSPLASPEKGANAMSNINSEQTCADERTEDRIFTADV